MTFIKNTFRGGGFIVGAAMLVLSACNKEVEQIQGQLPAAPYTPAMVFSASAKTLGDSLAARPADSLFYRLIERAGLLPVINVRANQFTIFAPTSAAIKAFVSGATGGAIPPGAPDAAFSTFIRTTLPVATAKAVAEYHIIPQAVPAANIPTIFPNFPYPTLFNPAPTLSPFARLDAYISRRVNGAWKDNVPVVTPDIMTGNGIIHMIAAVTTPPSELLWARVNTDPELTFLKAAILRADSGATAATPGSLQYYLSDQTIQLGANFTLFAPTDQAFKNGLYVAAFPIVRGQIFQLAYAQAIAGGATTAQATTIANAAADANAPAQTTLLVSTPAIFSNATLYPYLTATAVKGILFYHLLGVRTFTVNLPTTPVNIPTLLNGAVVNHPGITVSATFTGPSVTAATVKGLFNPTAANIIINPLPAGSSDQRYINGVMHKIDQVLFPAPL
jgi:uncharacterized surface protein with fasciclin (FAS1) repeats